MCRMDSRGVAIMDKKKAYAICIIFIITGCAAEIAFCPGHGESPAWWPLSFGVPAGLGFFGCWILIIAAKLIMAPLLQKDPDYYDEGGGEDD